MTHGMMRPAGDGLAQFGAGGGTGLRRVAREEASPRAGALDAQALAAAMGLPFTTLVPGMVRSEALAALPQPFLEKHNLLPLSLAEGWLTLAVEHFADVELIAEIGRRSGSEVQVVAAEPEQIRQVRQQVFAARPQARPESQARTLEAGVLERIGVTAVELAPANEEPSLDADALEASAADSPVVKLVNHIVCDAVEQRASDIHIEPDTPTFRVRYRIDGELVEALRPGSQLLPAVVSRLKIMGGMDISERRLPQDGGISVMMAGRPIDLRVSTMATKFGEKVVMRIVDREAAVPDLASIGFDPAMLATFRSLIASPNGIVLVTGPTGSGKTTTLYAGLGEILSDKRNISTIEDPIERRLRGTNQFQIHADAGFTFARALRALLRQDPDIVMVGEIRDTETARLAIEAALTGHLVLSTLHTNSAPAAIPRLVNMGVEPYLVAAALRGVLAQRLVRRICPDCRRSVRPDAVQQATMDQLHRLVTPQAPLERACELFEGTGCPACRHQGTRGRVGVFEMMPLTEALLASVVREPGMSHLPRLMAASGARSLVADGLQKVKAGQITLAGLLEIVSAVAADGGAEAEPSPVLTAA